MINTVCVFASSCNYLDETYYTAARELGKLIGQADMDMVYGGSCLGLMWACAENVKKNGGRIIGVMPEKLHEMDVYSDYCDEFFLTPCMRSRKAKMDELSDALIALPGGFGTLEELSEMIVQKQLGYNQKAVVILNTNGFYNPLLEMLQQAISQNFMRKEHGNIWHVAQTPEEAVNLLYTIPHWSKEIRKFAAI